MQGLVNRSQTYGGIGFLNHRTYDLSLVILNEEVEHESWFSEFLGEGPSGHFMRQGDTSPFVSKFQVAENVIKSLNLFQFFFFYMLVVGMSSVVLNDGQE